MPGRILVFAVVLLAGFYGAIATAATVTVDFEDAPSSFASGGGFYGSYETKGFELVSTYGGWAVIGNSQQIPNKAMLIGAWGFDFNLYGDDFSLTSFDVGFLNGNAGQIMIRGYRDGSQVVSESFSTPAGPQLPTYQTLFVGPGWDNLDRISFDISGAACCPGDASALDNIVLSSASAIPVPPAVWLFASALAALGGSRLKRRS